MLSVLEKDVTGPDADGSSNGRVMVNRITFLNSKLKSYPKEVKIVEKKLIAWSGGCGRGLMSLTKLLLRFPQLAF